MFRNSAVLGIDIGTRTVKAVVLSQKNDNYRALAAVTLPKPQPGEDTAVLQELKKTLKSQLGRWQTVPDTVVLGVSASSVVTKRVSLAPVSSDTERYQLLSAKLSEALTVSEEELMFDYQPAKSHLGNDDAEHFEAVVCRRSLLSNELAALEAADMPATIVDLQPHALLWLHQVCMQGLRPDSFPLLVDIGETKTQCCLQDGATLSFYKEIAFGTHKYSQLSDSESSHSFTSQLAEQITRQVKGASERLKNRRIGQIWLTGGAEQNVDATKLASLLGTPVQWLNPFSNFDVAPSLSLIKRQGASEYATAIGLALRGGHRDTGY